MVVPIICQSLTYCVGICDSIDPADIRRGTDNYSLASLKVKIQVTIELTGETGDSDVFDGSTLRISAVGYGEVVRYNANVRVQKAMSWLFVQLSENG